MTAQLPAVWRTDEDLAAAQQHFAAGIPGRDPPIAYGVARLDDGGLVFGHVNEPGGMHRLPAVVLAVVDDPPADDRNAAFRARLPG